MHSQTQWKGTGCKCCGAKGKDISCSGWEVRRDQTVLGEKWVDSVVSDERHCKTVLI